MRDAEDVGARERCLGDDEDAGRRSRSLVAKGPQRFEHRRGARRTHEHVGIKPRAKPRVRVVRVRECRAFEEERLCSVDARQMRQDRRGLLVPYGVDHRQRSCFFAKPARCRTEPRFNVALPFSDSPRCQTLDSVVACEVQEQLSLMKRGRVGAIAFEKGGQQAQQRRAFTVIAWHAATHARGAPKGPKSMKYTGPSFKG